MSKVEIYKLESDGTQRTVAICRMVDDKVVCEGDGKFIEYLNSKGITDYSSEQPKQIYPQNGKSFLEQLKNNFTSGYLNASEILED